MEVRKLFVRKYINDWSQQRFQMIDFVSWCPKYYYEVQRTIENLLKIGHLEISCDAKGNFTKKASDLLKYWKSNTILILKYNIKNLAGISEGRNENIFV